MRADCLVVTVAACAVSGQCRMHDETAHERLHERFRSHVAWIQACHGQRHEQAANITNSVVLANTVYDTLSKFKYMIAGRQNRFWLCNVSHQL